MRAGAGTGVSTTIELRRLDRVSAAAMAVRTIAANDTYKATTVGEGVYQFVRVYRPRWATVSGWIFTIGLLGAGYWLFLIKRTESCSMYITEDRATVRIILTGALLPEVSDRLHAAYAEVEEVPGPSAAVNDSETAVFGSGDDMLPVRVFRQAQTTTPPVVIDLVALERGEIDLRDPVELPVRKPDPVLDLPLVQFDSGEQIRVMGAVYVGSDPMQTDANGTLVERLTLPNSTGTLGKTHFVMGANLAGLWVEDMYSSTGTWYGSDAETAKRVMPLQRATVRPGEKIFFGDRSALVLTDDERVATNTAVLSPSSRV